MSNCFSTFAEQMRLSEVERLTAHIESGSDEVLNSIVALVSAHFGVPIAMVSIVDHEFQTYKAKLGIEADGAPLADSFCVHCMHGEGILEILNAVDDARFTDNSLVTGAPFIRYYAGAPLVTKGHAALGALCVIDQKERTPMSEQDRVFLHNAGAIVVARLESIHHKFFFDALTGLPNRQCFELDVVKGEACLADRLAILIEPLTASVMDRLVKALGLDCFVEFMLGVKNLLASVLPEGARLYRASTLSFAILLEDTPHLKVDELIERINEALAQPVHFKNVPIFADVGIGVLKIGPNAQASVDNLRLMASATDTARRSEHRWLYYDPAVDAHSQRSALLLHSIESALLAHDQLRLEYQPRINLTNGQCESVEALLRWTHPTLGEIGPAEFIGLAETTAVIRRITSWVVRNVCKQIDAWRTRGLRLTVSLNVSSIDLTDGQLIDELTQSLAHFNLAPQCIELEFTESVLIPDFDAVQQQLKRLRLLGVEIAIDDFGSGYSNWRYLRDIPAKSVKLDRSLLADLRPDTSNWHIVQGIIRLARNLNLTVVAEGVETLANYRLLRDWQCHQGQGYFFSRPLSPDALCEWVANGQTFDGNRPKGADAT
ncbi:GGDEF and EAL domain-containing protein [Pseudomonas sp. lyk4-R2A-8]|uniref:sensor domain-containing phosphodiesterase n=1 Tax=Pseudomonas sp. lyk4-R2A-8 TaxID=3040316 RepID=UPI00255735E7|nr:GGDEF and EAL domain-containing protein [Pseudomonas sp. lyk4-R2A-8]